MDQKIKSIENKTEFDADFSSHNPVNVKAAEERGLKFNERKQFYTDEDGCLIRDKYEQPL